ncbi:hypothetical protein [Cognatishimia sp. F0-27]|uniref:hypothetical protein n=1 Tax=Cognatishimia sp. F0-27 TaxID=2816855 RepID=UPI001D0BFDB2|nr:hypothetical protein [Cognatishimia sp. F0-27]MCC1492149.1 hypothetical protein [Cognatishimia sp. F0-27]
MSLSKQHEIHKRRFGRNLGVGLVLAALIAIVFGLTVAKVTGGDLEGALGSAGGTVDGN